jgi:hypothetical protein
MAVFAVPVYSATIIVDTLVDGTSVPGCSLREAVINANNDAVTHAGCAAGSGADTIILNVTGTYTLTFGEISVTSNITIQEASGVNAVISGNSSSRIFNVSTVSGDLTLNGLTVQDGNSSDSGGCIRVGFASGGIIRFNNGLLQNCTTSTSGGAIGSVMGEHSVYVSNSTLQNNTAAINGGAISQAGTGNVMSISDSTFTGNRTGTGTGNSLGGAIFYAGSNTASFSITGSTFSSNRAESTTGNGRGGAVYFNATHVDLTGSISGSTFTGNQALNGTTDVAGGGVFKTGVGSLTISSSVFTGNSAPQGGAIFNNQGNMSITTSRIQTNSAATNGSAYYSQSGGTDSITASCIVNNGDTAVIDTEVANNMTATGNWWGTSWGPRIVGAGGGSAISNGDSISGNGTLTVNVGLISAGGNPAPPPNGNWLSSAPTVAGATCLTCSAASSIGYARACS